MSKKKEAARMLDCAVIMHVHKLWELRGFPSYDSVRGAFPEGDAIYDGARGIFLRSLVDSPALMAMLK